MHPHKKLDLEFINFKSIKNQTFDTSFKVFYQRVCLSTPDLLDVGVEIRGLGCGFWMRVTTKGII